MGTNEKSLDEDKAKAKHEPLNEQTPGVEARWLSRDPG
jgi:hypothetical protein